MIRQHIFHYNPAGDDASQKESLCFDAVRYDLITCSFETETPSTRIEEVPAPLIITMCLKVGQVNNFRLGGCIFQYVVPGQNSGTDNILRSPDTGVIQVNTGPFNPSVSPSIHPLTIKCAPMAASPFKCKSTGRIPMAQPPAESRALPCGLRAALKLERKHASAAPAAAVVRPRAVPPPRCSLFLLRVQT